MRTAKEHIQEILSGVEFKEVEVSEEAKNSGIPYVTHEGLLKVGEQSLKVCVLNTGQRIIPVEEIERFFNL